MRLSEAPYYEIETTLENFLDYTDYTLTYFNDRVVEFPMQFEIVDQWWDESSGKEYVQLAFAEGEIIEEGTDLSEANLGNVDVGVAILFEHVKYITDKLLQVALKTEGLELSTLNGLIANTYAVTFKDLDGRIFIREGYYNKSKGEVWS